MEKNDIIKKLKRWHLAGRGGGCFPTADKWEMVKRVKGERKFVVCNASEGEPDVRKDLFILENYPGKVANGMKLAMDYLGAEKGYLYLNPDYYDKLAQKLDKLCRGVNIDIFRKPHQAGYIGGEETAALNAIEGRRIEPRMRPPFPPESGLWGFPTLVNNVETFFHVFQIAHDEFSPRRFFTVSGDILWPGVFEFPEETTIREVLKQTENLPDYDFFVQVGGGASGQVLDQVQIDVPAAGCASITVYSKIKQDPLKLIAKWLEFFKHESCGQCTPCREGTLRLAEIIKEKEPDWRRFSLILESLEESSFCALGCSVSVPIRSFVENVLRHDSANKIRVSAKNKAEICACIS